MGHTKHHPLDDPSPDNPAVLHNIEHQARKPRSLTRTQIAHGVTTDQTPRANNSPTLRHFPITSKQSHQTQNVATPYLASPSHHPIPVPTLMQGPERERVRGTSFRHDSSHAA